MEQYKIEIPEELRTRMLDLGHEATDIEDVLQQHSEVDWSQADNKTIIEVLEKNKKKHEDLQADVDLAIAIKTLQEDENFKTFIHGYTEREKIRLADALAGSAPLDKNTRDDMSIQLRAIGHFSRFLRNSTSDLEDMKAGIIGLELDMIQYNRVLTERGAK